MRLTKLEHSALVLHEDDAKLFIDPGAYTAPVADAGGAAGIVITHEHADHWTPEQLRRILDANGGEVPIFGPAGVAAAAADFDMTVVSAGETVTAGPFSLRFFGGRHAQIHSSIPIVDNVGVLVNDQVYYAGDSFVVPEDVDVDVLAVPAGAPWLKISESMDYTAAVAPRRSFTVHEMVLSEPGKDMSNARIRAVTEAAGGEFLALRPGDSIEI